RKRELRHRLADQRRGKPRGIAALGRGPEHTGERGADDQQKSAAAAPSPVWLTGRVGHEPRSLPVLALGFADGPAERRLIPRRSRSARRRRCFLSSSTMKNASAATATKVAP